MSRSKQLLLTLCAPPLLVLLGAVGFIWWERGAPPGFNPTAHPVDIRNINRNHRGVAFEGMARFDVRTTQKTEEGETQYYLFPIMPLDDINSKEIRVMVRTKKKPDTMADLEVMSIQGLARPPGRQVPQEVQKAWVNRGYTFHRKFVLVLAF